MVEVNTPGQHRRRVPVRHGGLRAARSAARTCTANVVAAVDAVEADVAGATTTDGCSPFENAGAVAGQIALVERGRCGFAVKARNAPTAGAAAVIIYNQGAPT